MGMGSAGVPGAYLSESRAGPRRVAAGCNDMEIRGGSVRRKRGSLSRRSRLSRLRQKRNRQKPAVPPIIVDETLEPTDFGRIRRGDVVGISAHTLNASRAYAVGRRAREQGAKVIFGGVHVSLFPEEAFRFGSATS